MLCLKFILLTLLTAASSLLVSGKTVITCDGDVLHLSCDTGLISVSSTVYGRTDIQTCSSGHTPKELAVTSCFKSISTIADRCNGLKVCEVNTRLLTTLDPCHGTYKYYSTTYTCISGHVEVICETGYTTLDCGDGSIEIINANYGRSDSVTCTRGPCNSEIKNCNCYAPNTFSTMTSMCNGHKKCTIAASSTIFTDPCPETSKYLTVSYRCTKQSVTCEGDTASLSCDTQLISIISANYGRTDSTTCSSGRPSNQISNTNCYTSNALNTVISSCQGQASCQVAASNGVFSDPCVGTYKYLKILYTCV